MPRKRVHSKRRLDAQAGAEVWSDVFRSGFPMFDDFAMDTGVEPDRNGRVSDDEARHAWAAFGPAFLALHGRDAPHWALQQFGEPHAS